MILSPSAAKLFQLLMLGAGLVFFSAIFFQTDLGQSDFIAFWAGAKLFLARDNPYDAAALKTFYDQAQFELPARQLFLNPPWALSTLFVLGLFNFKLIAAVFAAFSLFMLIVVVRTVELYYSRLCAGMLFPESTIRISHKAFILILAFYYPIYQCLTLGQLSLCLAGLLSLAFVLLRVEDARSRNWAEAAAGVLLALTTVKAHLLLLVYLYVFLVLFRARRYRCIYTFSLTALILGIFPALSLPSIYSFYFQSSKPTYYFTPTIGAWLQALSVSNEWLRLLPILIITPLMLAFWLKRHDRFNYDHLLTVVLPLSLVAAPYMWSYDFVLLIPTLGAVNALLTVSYQSSQKIFVVLAYASIFLAEITLAFGATNMHYDVWFPPYILSLVLTLNLICRTKYGPHLLVSSDGQ